MVLLSTQLQKVSNSDYAGSNAVTFCFAYFYRPALCRKCVFILWFSIKKYIMKGDHCKH